MDNKRWIAAVAACALGAPLRAADERDIAGLHLASDWLNSPPLAAADLRGKVVLIDFWTYTCINWLRTLPYVRTWGEKYRDHGLVVVGVHTPEFDFEKDVGNVRAAAEGMGISYSIAIDNERTVWRAFLNQAWPALYLVDAQGRVRFRHLGEGNYEETERAIQQLLAEVSTPTEI